MSYQFFIPTRTLFGVGKLNELHTQTMPGKKAMVVISNGKSMKETGTFTLYGRQRYHRLCFLF